MIGVNLPQEAGTNLYTTTAGEWGAQEVERLKGMDDLLTAVTASDLAPVFEACGPGATFLDIGAGSGTSVEGLCEQSGVDYFALDANPALLASRPTQNSRKILGKGESLPLVDGAVDITFSRAVTAWNGDPRAAIREQLRVTRPGGFAVFTEFDWSAAGMVAGSDALAEGEASKSALMLALILGGFKPRYGSILGSDIDAVAAESGLVYAKDEKTLSLPAGDYRRVFLDAAREIASHLNKMGEKNRGAATLGASLGAYALAIEDPAKNICMRLPDIMTVIIQKQ
jgi:SAM-dependent methyltransferase